MTPTLSPKGGAAPGRIYGAVAHAIDLLTQVLRWAIALMAMVILFMTAASVLDRHIFKTNFDAFEQYARLSLVWITFLGFAVALRERHAIRVEILDGILGPRARFWREVLFDITLFALAGLIVVKGWAVTEVGGFQDIIGTPLTYAWSYAALPVSAALICLFVALRIVGRCLGAPVDEAPHHNGAT